ncbi:MAG: dihydroorotate dehydrogenase electron transfer subunit [Desulfobacteraceae bacterium]|nr:dihydroorotate dehydrogenase electron transfer subunit [Desulfobacteraceae bacterium]
MKSQQKPLMLRVEKKIMESKEFATLFFKYPLPFIPGQFVMVWIPGFDEKPYTISFHDQDGFAITIEAKGLFSKKAITLDKGEIVGIRGPFGNGFTIHQNKRVAVVAGGCGMAPLAPLVETLDQETIFIQGARTKEFILFPDRFKFEPQYCTDDGSFGHKGFVTDLLKASISSKKNIDIVYTCGPEIMMHKVFEICEASKIPCQVSLERYMRCGFGVCGACVCGKEIVCKDGPVFESQTLRNMKDFNTKALLKSGKAVDLPDYFSWRCK